MLSLLLKIQIGLFGQHGQIELLLKRFFEKTGKTEAEVIKFMRKSLKPSSFRLWRKKVAEKSIKHRKLFHQSRKKLRAKISIDET